MSLFSIGGPITNPALGNTESTNAGAYLSGLLSTFIGVAFVGVVIIFFFMLVMGAISMITAGGDKGQYELSKSRITKAVIGIFILLLVFAIINLIGCVFGVSLLEFEIGEMNVSFSGSAICGGGSTAAGSPGGSGSPGPPPIPI